MKNTLRYLIFLCIGLLFQNCTSGTSTNEREAHRPYFHFTPQKNWMNDPNGLVFYDGEYHLFYQYNPFGNEWGHMSWGHAVSRDLIKWDHLPVALFEEDSVMIFSGSAVVDWHNSSSFGDKGKPPLVAIYTGYRVTDNRQFQCIAFSNDRGRNWTKYAKNPVIDLGMTDFRDPKVFWHRETKKWIMVVALSAERKVRLFNSDDLKNWQFLSDFGPAGSVTGVWECPDLFRLPVDGNDSNPKWVLQVDVGSHSVSGGSGGQYFIGDFDGKSFTVTQATNPAGDVLADFNGRDYAGWKTAGSAFGKAPAKGALKNQNNVAGYLGGGLVNSFLNGDAATGSLSSPSFVIEKPFINFLIAGGNYDDQTCMKLIVNGKVSRFSTGDNSEVLKWHYWDVSELVGDTAEIHIVDAHTGAWGHILVDQIMASEQPCTPGSEHANWIDYGHDFYAAVTYSDIPDDDGRRIAIAWMNNWAYAGATPTYPWKSSMSLPRSLEIRTTEEGLKLFQNPIKEVELLKNKEYRFENETIASVNAGIAEKGIAGELLQIVVEFEPGETKETGIKLRLSGHEETIIKYNAELHLLIADRSRSGNTSFNDFFKNKSFAPLMPVDDLIKLNIIVDVASVEVFGNEGKVSLTNLIYPSDSSRGLEFFSEGGEVKIKSLKIWTLK